MMLQIALWDTMARPVVAEILVKRETVEMRCRDRMLGVADREMLRQWVKAPFGVYTYDDVTWIHRDDGIYLSLGGCEVSGSLLAEHSVGDLRAQL